MNPTTALYINGLSVRFGGFAAITDLTLEIRYGETRALIGPNGAGKTTLMDVITGKTRPDSGEVFLDRTLDLATLGEAEIARSGIGRKFQKPSVFEALPVAQNLELAVRRGLGWGAMVMSRLSAAQRDCIDGVLKTIGLHDQRLRKAGELSHGQKQWLEIGMLLVAEPKVLLLDEPVAGMTEAESERTVELMAALRAPGWAVVGGEHDRGLVDRVADLGSVLHEGRLLGEGSMQAVRTNPKVIQVYLGR